MNYKLIDLIMGSPLLREKDFRVTKSKRRAEREVGNVRQSVYEVRGRFGFRDVAVAVSLRNYEIAIDLHLEQIQGRLVTLHANTGYVGSQGIGPFLATIDDPQGAFDHLLLLAFEVFFDPLETLDGICTCSHTKWKNEEPYARWAFHRSILEECGVVPRLTN